MVLHEALNLCPDLILLPPDHRFYEQKSKEVMALLAGYTPVVEQNSIDEAWLDMTGCEGLFGKPAEAAKKIMEDIKERLGLWCSIGIAENKFLSKMASEMKKPLGITELWQDDIPQKLWPLPVDAMYGIGSKTSKKLGLLGIRTIGGLAGGDINRLINIFGKFGNEIYLHANGIDDSPVRVRMAGDIKSIGRETTLPDDLTDIEKAKKVLLELSGDVGMSARMHGKKGHTVHITLKYDDFKVITRQTSVPATSVTREIFQAGCRLLEQNWNKSRPVRLIGISISGFDGGGWSGQLSFFDQKDAGVMDDKDEKIDRVMDKIRNKYGSEIIMPATLLKKE